MAATIAIAATAVIELLPLLPVNLQRLLLAGDIERQVIGSDTEIHADHTFLRKPQ